jgi:DNA-binding NtrC family response regulator
MVDATQAVVPSANSTARKRNEAMGLVVSHDPELISVVRRSCTEHWYVEVRRDWHQIHDIVGNLDVGIVVVDDDVVPEEERSRLIADIRVWFPESLIVYVAGNHSEAVERLARASGVLSYTSKPLDSERLERLLRNLATRAPMLVESAPHRPVS